VKASNKKIPPPVASAGRTVKRKLGRGDYRDQWDIIPEDEAEWRAAVIYEYSRESPILLKLITDLLQRGDQSPDFMSSKVSSIEFLHHQSPLLALMVKAAYRHKLKTSWTKPWKRLSIKNRRILVEVLPPAVREATREELKVAVIQGEKNTIEESQVFVTSSEEIGGQVYYEPMPIWTSLKNAPRSDEPRCVVALVVDSSLSAAMLGNALKKFIDVQLESLPLPGGPSSGRNNWKRQLLHLSGLRLRSSRSIEKARIVGSSVPEDRRPFLIVTGNERNTGSKVSETTERRRPFNAVETFSELFPVIMPPDLDILTDDVMISLEAFNRTNPRSKITSLKKP